MYKFSRLWSAAFLWHFQIHKNIYFKKIHILCLILYSLYIKILVQIKKIQTPFIGDMVEFKKNFFFNIDIWLNCLSLFAIIIEKSM